MRYIIILSVYRITLAKLRRSFSYRVGVVFKVCHCFIYKLRYSVHILLVHSPGGHCRCAQSQTACDKRASLLTGNSVFIRSDANAVKALLKLLAGELRSP